MEVARVAGRTLRAETVRTSSGRRARAATVVVGAAIAGGWALAAGVDPTRSSWFPQCPFHAFTGGWCPGCGMSRALHELARGHVVAAIGKNALVVALVPVLAYLLATWVVPVWTGRRLPPLRVRATGWLVIGVLVTTFFALRNIPITPFSALAP